MLENALSGIGPGNRPAKEGRRRHTDVALPYGCRVELTRAHGDWATSG